MRFCQYSFEMRTFGPRVEVKMYLIKVEKRPEKIFHDAKIRNVIVQVNTCMMDRIFRKSYLR